MTCCDDVKWKQLSNKIVVHFLEEKQSKIDYQTNGRLI